MIHLSAGTAACLGLTRAKMDHYPTTAYLLAGSHCLMNCAFCPQGQSKSDQSSPSRLGRISWPVYSWAETERALAEAERSGIKRLCLQAVRFAGGQDALKKHLLKIKAASDLPLSVSAWIGSVKEAEELFLAGADQIAISIDVVKEEAFKKYKGGRQKTRLKLLFACAEKYPGQISTHLICGLGESEQEMLAMINNCLQKEITTGLFAFTPLKGTVLENHAPPELPVYRRIQIAHYLLKKNIVTFDDLTFDGGELTSCGLSAKEGEEVLLTGEAFRTSGCPDCNRPYYNEHPGREVYNYHYPPAKSEIRAAIKASGLF